MITLRSQEYLWVSDTWTPYYWLLVMPLTLDFMGTEGINACLPVALTLSGSGKEHQPDD